MQLHEKLNAPWVLPSCLQESKWHSVLSPAPHIQHKRLPCCHFSARHVSLKGHKCHDRCHTDISPQGWLYEPNSSKHSGPAAAGLDSTSSHSARFKLLRINADVHRPRWLGTRLTRGVTKEGSSCVTRSWVRRGPEGSFKRLFNRVAQNWSWNTLEIFQGPDSWAVILDVTYRPYRSGISY